MLLAVSLGAAACSSSTTPAASKKPSTTTPAKTSTPSTTSKASTAPKASAAELAVLKAMGPKTLASGTADLNVTLHVTNPPSGGKPSASPLSGTIAGGYNLSNGEGNLRIALSGTVASLLGGPLNVTLGNGNAYFAPPATLARLLQLQPGKTYASLPLSSLTSLLNLGALGSSFTGDPSALFNLFATPALQVSDLGSATVGGVATTEYKISVDLSQAAADGGAAGTLYKEIKAGSPTLKSLAVDVWAGPGGRLHQLAITLSDLSASLVWSRGASLALAVVFSHFGVAVPVSIPPPSAVQSVSGLP